MQVGSTPPTLTPLAQKKKDFKTSFRLKEFYTGISEFFSNSGLNFTKRENKSEVNTMGRWQQTRVCWETV